MLLATGMDYRYPDLPGVAERWGGAVFHCPFCHGWEVRDRPLGVLDRGEMGMHRALLLRHWSDDVTLFTSGPSGLAEPDVERLAHAGVAIEERGVTGLRGPAGTLEALTLAGGGERRCAALLVPAVMHQRSNLAQRLGARAAAPSPLAADPVAVDAALGTGVPGLLAAGDLSGQRGSMANALAAGSNAAATIVHSLLVEDHGLAAHAPAPAHRA